MPLIRITVAHLLPCGLTHYFERDVEFTPQGTIADCFNYQIINGVVYTSIPYVFKDEKLWREFVYPVRDDVEMTDVSGQGLR
jgi:hypothetical protein